MRFSPSTLNLFLECPRCFWLKMNKDIHRPQGPFSTLPGSMDSLIKKYFDYYRLRGQLPPELEGRVEGAELFPDIEVLNKWRNWRTGLTYDDRESGAILSGALDDLMVKNNKYIPTDYKTRGYDVKEGGESLYQNQLNLYALLLEKNNMPPIGYGWLIYWIPKEIEPKDDQSARVSFYLDLKKVPTNTEAGLKVMRDAAALLKGPLPEAHSQCQFCSFGINFYSD